MAEDRMHQRARIIEGLIYGRDELFLTSASFKAAVTMLTEQLIDVMDKVAAIAEGQKVRMDDAVEEILRGGATTIQDYGRQVRRSMEGREDPPGQWSQPAGF